MAGDGLGPRCRRARDGPLRPKCPGEDRQAKDEPDAHCGRPHTRAAEEHGHDDEQRQPRERDQGSPPPGSSGAHGSEFGGEGQSLAHGQSAGLELIDREAHGVELLHGVDGRAHRLGSKRLGHDAGLRRLARPRQPFAIELGRHHGFLGSDPLAGDPNLAITQGLELGDARCADVDRGEPLGALGATEEAGQAGLEPPLSFEELDLTGPEPPSQRRHGLPGRESGPGLDQAPAAAQGCLEGPLGDLEFGGL